MSLEPVSLWLPGRPGSFAECLHEAVRLGFESVVLRGVEERSLAEREALAETGLFVQGVLLEPADSSQALDHPSVASRRLLVQHWQRQILDAAQLGARLVCLRPGNDVSEGGLLRFAEGLQLLTEYAARRSLACCLMPTPGSGFPDVQTVVTWAQRMKQDHLRIAFDLPSDDLAGTLCEQFVRVKDCVGLVRLLCPRAGCAPRKGMLLNPVLSEIIVGMDTAVSFTLLDQTD